MPGNMTGGPAVKWKLLRFVAVLAIAVLTMPASALAVGDAEWGERPLPAPVPVFGVATLTEEVAVVGGVGQILRTMNGGATWDVVWDVDDLSDADVATVYDVAFAPDGLVGHAVGLYNERVGSDWHEQSLTLRSEDGGRTWQRTDNASGDGEPALRAIDVIDGETWVAAGDDSTWLAHDGIYASKGVVPPGTYDWNDVAWHPEERIFVLVGKGDGLARIARVRYENGSSTPLVAAYPADTDSIECVTFYPEGGQNLHALGENGVWFRSNDLGASWDRVQIGSGATLDFWTGCDVVGDEGWIVGWRAQSLADVTPKFRHTDDFVDWDLPTIPDIGQPLQCIDMHTADQGWAGGGGGKMIHKATTTVERLFGPTRYETAIEISEATFPDEGADVAVIATGQDFPDALSAAGLAGVSGGPLLLTAGVLTAEIQAELDRLGVEKVYIVGGTGVVPDSVATALSGAGFLTERVAGSDRYATAAAVASKVAELEGDDFSKSAFVARGDEFPDALAVSPAAYSQGIPVLLTRPTAMPPATSNAIGLLDIDSAYIAGGAGAVSDGVKSALDALLASNGGPASNRWAGADRYATAVDVAENILDNGWGKTSYVGVATGLNFPDALAGGVACGAMYGPLLLTRPDGMTAAAGGLVAAEAAFDTDTRVYGGSAVVGDAIVDELKGLY
jgi:putative cell wall-binding protein/photosystem II stability/assembly factor-like uncharacterized protein